MTPAWRAARPDDYPTFVRLFGELRLPDPIPDEAKFAGEIAPHALVVIDGGQPVGYGLLHVYAETAHLVHVISAPEARGRGVGAAILAALAERAREAGCRSLYLNVKPDNVAALRLYQRAGFRVVGGSKRMQIAWRDVDGLPPAPARAFEPTADADPEIEHAFDIPAGVVATRRAQKDVVLAALLEGGAPAGFAAFDTRFPGASPFRARRPDVARALLEAMRPHARPEHDFVGLLVDARDGIASSLLAAGATTSFEVLQMASPLV